MFQLKSILNLVSPGERPNEPPEIKVETVKYDEGKVKARYMYFDGLRVFFENVGALNFNQEFADLSKLLAELARNVTKSTLVELAAQTADLYTRRHRRCWITGVAEISEHGALKYGAFNYRLGTNWSRYVDAIGRHFILYMNQFRDQTIDADSGHNHLLHILANILILLVYVDESIGQNDVNI